LKLSFVFGLVLTTSHTALPVPLLSETSAIGTLPLFGPLSVAVTAGKKPAVPALPSLVFSPLTSWA
jgi:hypothetical protein